MMLMKPEVKDRVISHDHPVIAAFYNKKFNQVRHIGLCINLQFNLCLEDSVFFIIVF